MEFTDRILASHWHQAISSLRVAPALKPFQKQVLDVIQLMQDERVVVEPFTTFPRRGIGMAEHQKLLKLSFLTPEIVARKIQKERIRRLCLAYHSLQTYKFQQPWIV